MTAPAEFIEAGLKHQQAGDLAQAEYLYRQALELNPAEADAWHLLGLVEHQRGRNDAAVAGIRRAIELSPQLALYHGNLGEIFRVMGQLEAAVGSCRRAIELAPSSAGAHNSLGLALMAQRQMAEAIRQFESGLEKDPNSVQLWNNLGEAYRVEGRFDQAAECFRRALRIEPQLAAAHLNLGNVLRAMRKNDEAAACYRTALELRPGYAKALSNLSSICLDQQQLDEALRHGEAALRSDPTLAEAQANMSSVEYQQGRLSAAIGHAHEALRLKPDLAAAYNLLGTALQDQGQSEDALAYFERALESSAPHEQPRTHNNLLFCLQHISHVTPQQVLAAHQHWNSAYALPLANQCPPPRSEPRDSAQPLRFGLVSADLGCHPVGQFVQGWLEHLDRRRIEVYCYSDRPIEDTMSRRLRRLVSGWRDVQTLDDASLAESIRADRVDILCDLAGHTRGNRLLTFARRPAPVQASWMGYVGTTGLSAIDFLIADQYVIPIGAEDDYCERIVRLPDGWLCYSPADDTPDVSPPPCLAGGCVTFGCFNNCSKMGPAVVAAWAEILRRVPDSRLVLKFKWFDDAGVRQRYENLFAEHGIAPGRIEMLGWTPQAEHLKCYGRIDLALDTFPYTGGVTTCESLLMGVPVVTCVGATFASRQSYSHLSNVGLSELCARDVADYIDRAVNWASDRSRLAQLRNDLRPRLLDSPLCNAQTFASHLTATLESMWERRNEVVRPADH